MSVRHSFARFAVVVGLLIVAGYERSKASAQDASVVAEAAAADAGAEDANVRSDVVDGAATSNAEGALTTEPAADVVETDAALPAVSEPVAPVVTTAPSISNEQAGPSASPGAIEVTVQAAPNAAAKRARESAEAVHVIETTNAKRETADLGEVLARNEGIGVRRSGGLGAEARVSLNGLTDDQIRYFIDGVPLDLAGYGFGIANVPVNFAERVDVYRGVVPVRFGVDALGGAVNLVTDQEIKRSYARASYQTGAFGTHRLNANGLYAHTPSGMFTRATGFLDRAENDYVVDVEAANAAGQSVPASVHRANDKYRGSGVSAEVGVAGRPWAKLLSVRGFVSDYDKGFPHNVVMETNYGRVRYGLRSYGAILRYERRLAHGVQVQAIGGYALDLRYFKDVSTGIYDWYGRRTGDRSEPGEIERGGSDIVREQNSVYARAQLSWRFLEDHALRLSVSPNYSRRIGEDSQVPEGTRDPLDAKQRLLVLVTGLEYQADLLERSLENIAFAKDYIYRARAGEQAYGGGRSDKDASYHRGGVGDSLRFRVRDDLYLKASYEWTTRLPHPDEVFGDGMRVSPNLELRPETSHNANAGATYSREVERIGVLRADGNLFLRDAENLISKFADEHQDQSFYQFQNVTRARSAGLEMALGWTSPGELIAIDGNLTYQDFRNLSTEGPTAKFFHGERMVNRPWLYANGSARFKKPDAILKGDTIELGWYTRYVHEFYRGWGNAGRRDTKNGVPSQLAHAILLTYLVQGTRWTFSSTLELDNLTDAKLNDFYGVQRPGRAAYYKATLAL